MWNSTLEQRLRAMRNPTTPVWAAWAERRRARHAEAEARLRANAELVARLEAEANGDTDGR